MEDFFKAKPQEPESDWLWERWIRIGRFYATEYSVTYDDIRYVMDFDN